MVSILTWTWISWSVFIFFFGRLWRPQYDLQCVSCSVTQLQQPVWWWIWHRIQTEALHSLHLLFFGSIILEKVPVLPCNCTNIKGIKKKLFWKSFLYLFIFFISLSSGKRCAVGLSTRVALVRWLLTLDSSSLAAVPKNKRWDPHKWPQASLTHFPSSSRKTGKKTGDCFYRTPLQGRPWHPPLSPVADLHVSVPPMKSVRFFFLLIVSFYMGIFLHFCIESIFSFIKKEKKLKKMLRALVLFIGRGQNVRHNFWFWIILIILY